MKKYGLIYPKVVNNETKKKKEEFIKKDEKVLKEKQPANLGQYLPIFWGKYILKAFLIYISDVIDELEATSGYPEDDKIKGIVRHIGAVLAGDVYKQIVSNDNIVELVNCYMYYGEEHQTSNGITIPGLFVHPHQTYCNESDYYVMSLIAPFNTYDSIKDEALSFFSHIYGRSNGTAVWQGGYLNYKNKIDFHPFILDGKGKTNEEWQEERKNKNVFGGNFSFLDIYDNPHFYDDHLSYYPRFYVNKGNQSNLGMFDLTYGSFYPGMLTISETLSYFPEDEKEKIELYFQVNKTETFYKNIILDLLYRSGFDVINTYTNNMLDLGEDDSNSKYYINVIFKEQITIKEALEKIADYVGIYIYYRNDRFYIKPKYSKVLNIKKELSEEEITFNINSQKKEELYSIYTAEWEEFSDNLKLETNKRQTTLINETIWNLSKEEKRIDLSCYRDEETVKTRLTEILNSESWEKKFGSFSTNLFHYDIVPGDIVKLNLTNSLGGAVNVFILSKEIKENGIEFKFVEYSPISDYNSGAYPSPPIEPTYIPSFTSEITELPSSIRYENNTVVNIACFTSNKLYNYLWNHMSDDFSLEIYKSATYNGEYSLFKTLKNNIKSYDIFNSLKGYTTSAYIMGKNGITFGIKKGSEHIFTIYNVYKSIFHNRYDNKFDFKYLAILDISSNEKKYVFMEYVSHTNEEYTFKILQAPIFEVTDKDYIEFPTSVRVQIIALYPDFQNQNWFGIDTSYNYLDYQEMLELNDNTPFYAKLRLVNNTTGEITSLNTTNIYYISPNGIAQVPLLVGDIKAERNGNDVEISWYPTNWKMSLDGAGVKQAQDCIYNTNPQFEGSFVYSIDGGVEIEVNNPNVTISNSGSFTIEVKQKINGIVGEGRSLNIGIEDKIYKT